MNEPEAQQETSPERYGITSESSEEGRSPASGEITPFRKSDSRQYAQPTTVDDSTARTRRGGGPRTSRGKEKSRRNSLVHGIFAKVTLLDDESRGQYDALLQGFRDYFKPEGVVEEVHVEELATLKWRQRRLLQAERAEIQNEKKFNSRALDREQQERGEAAILEISTTGQKYGLLERRENPFLLNRAIELLDSLKNSVETTGFTPDEDRGIISKVFGEEGRTAIRGLYELCLDPAQFSGHSVFKGFDLSPEACKAQLLDYLKDEINSLRRDQRKMERRFAEREKLESQSAGVPEPSSLDRLLKYGASIQRDYDRSLNQLERLQRARKGQPVLPTLNVNVST